jgi:hypothetical protein
MTVISTDAPLAAAAIQIASELVLKAYPMPTTPPKTDDERDSIIDSQVRRISLVAAELLRKYSMEADARGFGPKRRKKEPS